MGAGMGTIENMNATPKQQPQSEWPKYWLRGSITKALLRVHPNGAFYWWNVNEWVFQLGRFNEDSSKDEQITSEQAAVITGEGKTAELDANAVKDLSAEAWWESFSKRHNTSVMRSNTTCYAVRDYIAWAMSQSQPNWLPISQCDLKPGEAFWARKELHDDVALFKSTSFGLNSNPKQWLFKNAYTHFLRALPPYAVPEAPKVEVKKSMTMDEWCKSQDRYTEVLAIVEKFHEAIKKGEVEI